jgi:hypothetical protein
VRRTSDRLRSGFGADVLGKRLSSRHELPGHRWRGVRLSSRRPARLRAGGGTNVLGERLSAGYEL